MYVKVSDARAPKLKRVQHFSTTEDPIDWILLRAHAVLNDFLSL